MDDAALLCFKHNAKLAPFLAAIQKLLTDASDCSAGQRIAAALGSGQGCADPVALFAAPGNPTKPPTPIDNAPAS
jgi:hypothetical protein